MPGRSFQSEVYRYGYQGSERDPEMSGGAGYTTYFRALDPRIGRWLTPDPKVFPWQSPYVSMDGNPVALIDPWGASTGGGGKKNSYQAKGGNGKGALPCPGEKSGTKHTVLKGDTFWALEKQLGISHGTLSSLNPGVDPNSLRIGEDIWVAYNNGSFIVFPNHVNIDESGVRDKEYDQWSSYNNSGEYLAAWLEGIVDGGLVYVEDYWKAQVAYLPGAIRNLAKGSSRALTQKLSKKIKTGNTTNKVVQEAAKGVELLGDDFIASATKPWGNQGLTEVGRALQKHAGREGSVFQNIKFSHKTANQEALNIINKIKNSPNQIVQPAENGGTLIFDKSTGMGVGVSRNGLFNGFRELPK